MLPLTMEGRAWIAGGEVAGSSNSLLAALGAFCAASVSTCSSRDAGRVCASAGLTCLSALLLLLSCLLVARQRCTCRGGPPGESITASYCLLGNLCSTVGATLSRQLYIQVLMGALAVALDAVNCILCCFPVLLCWNSKAERRLRIMKRRRRQHLLAVCVLMVVAGGFLKSRVTHPPAFWAVGGRRLLHVPLQVSSWGPFTDQTEILGYILGLLSFVIACTSTLPALCRAYKGHMLTQASIFSGLLCSLAGALYTAAMLLYDTEFGYLMRVMPWLLSSISCAALDLLVLVIHWCKRGTRQRSIRFSSDTVRLLGGSGTAAEDNAVMKRQRKQQGPSSAQAKKMTEMGRYMDVSVQPARKISLKEVTLSKKEEVGDGPLDRMVRVIRVDSFCSTNTSDDSSSQVSSDLEWDFEAANARWSVPTVKRPEGDEFPLQEWPTTPTTGLDGSPDMPQKSTDIP